MRTNLHILTRPWTLLFATLVAGAPCLARQSLDGRVQARVDSLIQNAIDREVTAGAVVLINRGDSVVYQQAYGYARLVDFGGKRLERPEKMTTDHLFDQASLTKVFATTFAIMLLVDRGHVDLDAPVGTYLRDFRGAGKDSVTVRHLLTHTAGLQAWEPVYYHARTPDSARAYVTRFPLAHPVGKQRVYSDLGFMLLGYLVESVTGHSVDVYLEHELYGPLGLRHALFNPLERGAGPFAATSHGNPFERLMVADDDFGYVCDEDPESFTDWRQHVLIGEVNDGNAFYAHGGVAGHAGLFSTADELKVLIELLLQGGRYGGRRYVQDKTVSTFLTADGFGNGLGWAMSEAVLGTDELPAGSFGHTGFTGTFALAVPAYDLSLVLLTNRQHFGVDDTGHYPSVTPLRRDVTRVVLEAVGAPN